MRIIGLIAALVGLLGADAATAGEVRFINGDHLSGTIVRTEKGQLILTSDVVGQVKIPMAKIAGLRSDTSVTLELDDGTVISDTLGFAEDGRVGLASHGESLDLARVSRVNPPAPEDPEWVGEAKAGVTIDRGTHVAA